MEIIDIDGIPGRHIATPGVTRTIKDILVTDKMTTHWAMIPPGQSTTEHSHPLSEEIVYIVRGRGKARAGEQTGEFKTNQLMFIPEAVPHRFTNTGDEELVIFVVYSPPAEVPKK
jgi:mannose-6-phosphate isomerase-like protein (cupin superfamily)